MFYCEDYIKAQVSERFDMVKAQRTCGRCLTMARKFTNRKSDWWAAHERYCKTSFACKEGLCAGKPKERQLHMTICFTHATENRAAEPDFIKSLDSKEWPSGFSLGNLRFLHMLGQFFHQSVRQTGGVDSHPVLDSEGYEIIPYVADSAIFMMQLLPSEVDATKDLLCFYDSGCGAAGVSDRACGLLKNRTVQQGPTVLDVAGAKSILIPYGDESFHLEVEGTKQTTFTGLRMPNITSPFPAF